MKIRRVFKEYSEWHSGGKFGMPGKSGWATRIRGLVEIALSTLAFFFEIPPPTPGETAG